MTLPTPRHFLTNLINRLPTIPLEPPQPPSINRMPNSNALSRIPVSHRHLIITLHVLFPNLVLPSLDLLDRGLVQKFALSDKIKSEEPEDDQAEVVRGAIYVVYSTTAAPSRRRKSVKPDPDDDRVGNRENSQKYVVHLQAWNCTCAAFAFSIVQSLLDEQPPQIPPELHLAEITTDDDKKEWEFGGMSTDGKAPNGGQIPTCKHLLACLLAERWGNALGGYVTSKQVGKEEMAGIVADV
ncbi:Putative protein of unknown function [Podospora comata]|uniref:SWIM-type domain-containing protein n=1 Tax=Podospora comata TaxID=48703 RepID=A0ABY6S6T3_PODCO|nr:Putative protein of unknown function [Podospora comata]